jgi:hypothetical protein
LIKVTQQERAAILEFGVVNDHVHLLVLLHPTTSLPRLIQRLKGGSAVLANREGHARRGCPLHWAKGYNVETVSPSALPGVREYIRKQPQHHPERAIPNAPVASATAPPSRDRRKSFRAALAASRIGYRLSAIGYWLLAIGYRLSAIGYWLLAIGYWLCKKASAVD